MSARLPEDPDSDDAVLSMASFAWPLVGRLLLLEQWRCVLLRRMDLRLMDPTDATLFLLPVGDFSVLLSSSCSMLMSREFLKGFVIVACKQAGGDGC